MRDTEVALVLSVLETQLTTENNQSHPIIQIQPPLKPLTGFNATSDWCVLQMIVPEFVFLFCSF